MILYSLPQVMIDRDLAEFYQVKRKVLNQAVKRNLDILPDELKPSAIPPCDWV